jgi:hypothetical protein
MTLILFTTSAPDPLAAELSRLGHHVNEAIAVSEVLALSDQHPSATSIITCDINPERAKVMQHYPTMHLKPGATVQDILWELNLGKAQSSSEAKEANRSTPAASQDIRLRNNSAPYRGSEVQP